MCMFGQARASDRPHVRLCMCSPVTGQMHTASYVVRQLLLDTKCLSRHTKTLLKDMYTGQLVQCVACKPGTEQHVLPLGLQ